MLVNHIDIWDSAAQAICIPTNRIVKRNGEAVMGAGLAKQAAKRYPELPKLYGNRIELSGKLPYFPVVIAAHNNRPVIICVPTKDHWKDSSTLESLKYQLSLLENVVPEYMKIAVPYFGAGLGGLDRKVVFDLMNTMLSDRFVLVQVKNNESSTRLDCNNYRYYIIFLLATVQLLQDSCSPRQEAIKSTDEETK